ELTSGLRTALYQGKGLGGGSLIYGAVAMKPQDFIFDEWSRLSGVASINGESLEPHYKHIAEVMSVTKQAITQENKSNSIVRQMAAALGQSDGLETVSRYTQGCAGAGLCNLGCGFNLKGTMANSFIPLGLETGNLTILTECEAHGFEGTRSTTDSYRANGLKVTIKDFSGGVVVRRGTIKARHFILAAGAFFSSALLLNNRELPGRERIGRKIYLQPHAQIFALFDEPITKRGQIKDGQYIPYHGVPAIYNFTGFMRTHRFFWLASILFPANFASFISHLDASQHFELMQRFHQTMSITLTLKDDPEKSKIVMRDGQAQLDFKESRADIENLRQC
ncbi:MAG TPA: GMC family oxidoreductase N-terminal domain-containing protein, partial [Blastocatellia bacterium]|nr:GMC family oxidoreductase N-terminal domain-containing protein [Blastocatellia bacterium]